MRVRLKEGVFIGSLELAWIRHGHEYEAQWDMQFPPRHPRELLIEDPEGQHAQARMPSDFFEILPD